MADRLEEDGGFGPGVTATSRWTAGVGWERLKAGFDREMSFGRGALWVPVLFGAGVLLYFGLPREPSLAVLLVTVFGVLAVGLLGRRRIGVLRLSLALAAIAAGTATMKLRTELVAAPIVTREVTGELTGWVEDVERFSPTSHRLVIRVIGMEDLEPTALPERVRITVRGAFDVAVGDGVAGLVALQPPAAPVIPGGYDFGRELFYEGIGGSGFSYGPPDIVDLGPPPTGIAWKIPLERLRQSIRARIEAQIPGDNGQIAVAMIIGEQGGISEETKEIFRTSGLAHILSISGLHMALIAGSAFWLIRALLALSMTLALTRPIKKWAAAGALCVATFYLAISGGEVATQRSYIMFAVMLVAILLDRRALTVRNVAVAAMIILVVRPESILTASFQMSFAATLALVAGFEFFSERRRERLALGPPPRRTALRVGSVWVGGMGLTSLLAGLATAPFGAFHFHRTAPLSLIANLLAAPVVTFLVMYPALAAMILMPLGLEAWPLAAMEYGIRQVVAIAVWIADWTGEGGRIAAAPLWALFAVVFGGLWLALWRERWRYLGVLPIVAGLAAWGTAPRPAILIDETGSVAAVRGVDGTFTVVGDGADFEVDTWLRADADLRVAGDPTLAEGVLCDRIGCTAPLPDGTRLALLADARGFAEDCRNAAVLVTAQDAPEACGPAWVVDGAQLALTGAQALYADGEGGWRTVAARPEVRRPWMPPILPPQ